MKTIVISKFVGQAEDRFAVGNGKFAHSKNFDILTTPNKLQPLRGMAAHTGSTGIGNLVVAADGLMYGVGLDISGGNPTFGKLYVLAGYGSGDNFAALSTNQLSGGVVRDTASTDDYAFFVDWPECSATPGSNVRKIHWASTNLLIASNYSGGAGSAATQSLTFTSISQGLVHPKDKNLYFAYRNSTTPFIGKLVPNDTAFAGLNATALTLPLQYRVFCLSYFGNYLAIPLTSTGAVSLVNSSILALWDRDTSQTTFSETVHWGSGVLKVINNLHGVLVGISEVGSDSLQAGTTQDYNAIRIKVWPGSGEPIQVADIKAQGLSGGSGQPSVVLYPRVNFIFNSRMYFAVKVNPNDGIQPSRIGLFSIGRNKVNGNYEVVEEKIATTDNSETAILAASIVGDYVEIVHTAAGTLTKSINGNPSSSTYAATSVYESGVNPDMSEVDKILPKKLFSVSAHFEPIPTSGSLVLKYRIDSKGRDSDWVTIATASTAGSTFIEMPNAAGTAFTDGRNFEFRVESTGGVVVTGLSYKYDTLTSLIEN